jgi:hypothetical protein
MMTRAVAILAVSGSAALAGTKYQANLVPASAVNPPADPTMESGKLSLKDTADIKAKVKGVTDSGGVPVTGSTSYADTGTLDGSEYVVILKANFTALNVDVEKAIPMSMKNGGGKGAVSLASLLSLLPPGIGRSVEVTGGEVWGPLGAPNAAPCQAELTAGYALGAGSSACRAGDRVGVAGIAIP